jgi:hypothetical protein
VYACVLNYALIWIVMHIRLYVCACQLSSSALICIVHDPICYALVCSTVEQCIIVAYLQSLMYSYCNICSPASSQLVERCISSCIHLQILHEKFYIQFAFMHYEVCLCIELCTTMVSHAYPIVYMCMSVE